MVKQRSLKLEHICKAYHDENNEAIEVLRDISMNIDQGSIVAIVGPSGCGKSTLLRLIAGLDNPEAGSIVYNGKQIKTPDIDIGFVFQSPNLFPWLTVKENIAFGLKARKALKKNQKYIQGYIDLLGLVGFENAYPYQLSGGMASRVSLARTFVQESRMILLDEPLSALDAFTKANIQDEILKIWDNNKPIIILVTHDIEEAVYLSDRVLVMSHRPGRFIGSIGIDIPRPRDRVSEKFIEKRKEILEIMNR